MLTMLNAFQGEIIISCLYAWTDSQVSLAWIKALHKEFQTFVQNRVVEIRKNISPENWSYCSTKVNPSDLITCLDKNIDLSKTLYGGEAHAFYSIKVKVILNVTIEFKREMKNEVISPKVEHLPINTVDNIIDIKG